MSNQTNDSYSFTDRLRAVFSRDPYSRTDDSEDSGNRGLVITLCIVAACVMWFAFSMQETYTQIIDLPTEMVNLPSDEALVKRPPDFVRIQVEGEGIQLLRLYYNRPPVRINVSQTTVDLELAVSELTKNVNLATVTPRTVQIEKEQRVVRRIPVVSRLNLSLEPGHRVIGRVEITPDTVSISGAASIVNNMRAWPTQPRRMDGVEDTVNVMLALSDTLDGLVAVNARAVRVFADIQEFTEGRRTLEVRITDSPPGKAVALDPPRVSVVYQVPLSQYDRAQDSPDFYAFVPYDRVRNDSLGLVYPMLNIPPGLDIREYRMAPSGLNYYDIEND